MSKFDDTDIQELKDLVTIGIVSSVNTANMTARVKIQDTGTVTGDLKIVQNTPTAELKLESGTCEGNYKVIISPWKPKVGQWVLCIFKPGGDGDGFILGGV